MRIIGAGGRFRPGAGARHARTAETTPSFEKSAASCRSCSNPDGDWKMRDLAGALRRQAAGN